MKDRLIFDTTDVDSIAASDSIGAYLRSSDGTLLTHSTVGGKKALDVSIADGVNVEVDLSHTDDSVRLGNGTDFFTSTSENSDIALDVHISNSSIVVTATDLDIRDLTAASDSVDSWLNDGSGTALTSTLVGAKQSLDVYAANDPSASNTAIASAAETLDVANTAQNVVASPLSNRKALYIYNKDNQTMFIGQSGVTASNGFPIAPSSYIELKAGAAIDIEYVSAKLNHEIRTLELS